MAKIKDENLITRENCGQQLIKIRELAGNLSRTGLAEVLGVSRSSIHRIEERTTLPSEEFLSRLDALQVLGASRYQELSEKEKTQYSKFFETLGMVGAAGALGAVSVGSISRAGVLIGLNAIGIAGIVRTSIAPFGIGAGIALGVMQAFKAILDANKLYCEEVDGRWEILIKPKEKEQDNDEKKSE